MMEHIEIKLIVPKGLHKESTDMCYKSGTFVELSECQDCKTVQDYWSNNSGICAYCGGLRVKSGVGKWDNTTKKWQKRA